MKFPEGKEFAFTILDDTDDTTVENGRPAYRLLAELGLRITKTVWALDTPPEDQGDYFAGETLRRPEYLEWAHELAGQGFEIAFHNASMGTSTRERTIAALDFLEREFKLPRVLHCNHGQNRENLYWGAARYSSLLLAGLAHGFERFAGSPRYEGHIEGSRFFWGDIASTRVRYVRAFALNRLDCARIPPGRPFYDARKPYIRRWFNTADAPYAAHFKTLVTRRSIDALHGSRSWCIVSTHIGKGFCKDGRIDPEIEGLFRYIASLPGWFVPASDLLDYLWQSLGEYELTASDRLSLELAHIWDRVRNRFM